MKNTADNEDAVSHSDLRSLLEEVAFKQYGSTDVSFTRNIQVMALFVSQHVKTKFPSTAKAKSLLRVGFDQTDDDAVGTLKSALLFLHTAEMIKRNPKTGEGLGLLAFVAGFLYSCVMRSDVNQAAISHLLRGLKAAQATHEKRAEKISLRRARLKEEWPIFRASHPDATITWCIGELTNSFHVSEDTIKHDLQVLGLTGRRKR